MVIPAHADVRRWSVDNLSVHLGVPIATLYKWRCIGYGPKSVRLGRYIRYRQADVLGWLDSLTDVA
ncbi:MAG: helix-turn-helix domain-containing protein [Propionibacteriaceae bacterium]